MWRMTLVTMALQDCDGRGRERAFSVTGAWTGWWSPDPLRCEDAARLELDWRPVLDVEVSTKLGL